ncbi:MAG: FKBP-type peptidyl-prolyl cis-trans isomerase [Bacteroidota bacterium]
MKIRYVISLILLAFVSKGYTQNANSKMNVDSFKNISNFRIGENIPDFELNKIINFNNPTANLKQFKNQLLILDFWALSCSSCIAALPHMEELQKQFGNKITILPVTSNPESYVAPFWKTNRYTKSLKLPTVVDDEVLTKYFENIYVPHEVWIYKGKVIGITDAERVTKESIEKVLNGDKINWPVKNDFFAIDVRNAHLFKPDANQIDTTATFINYAAISDYKEINGANAGGSQVNSPKIIRDTIRNEVRVAFLNSFILDAYFLLWNNQGNSITKKVLPPNSGRGNGIEWRVNDKYRYYFDEKMEMFRSDELRDNGICFEAVYPDCSMSDSEIYGKAIRDLNNLLGLNIHWEKRKEKVLKLINSGKILSLSKKSKAVDAKKVFNTSFLVSKINAQNENPYVFDETRLIGEMSIELPDWRDISTIKKKIAPYGLILKEEELLVDKLIFEEIDGGLMVDAKLQAQLKEKADSQKSLSIPTTEENDQFLKTNSMVADVITLPSGLQYKVIKAGSENGAEPSISDKVFIRFTGTLINGKIFDSSDEKGKPVILKVKDTIKGWQEALQMMSVGAKWVIYVPAELAYGTHTAAGKVPPNSNLIFEIELLAIGN